VHDGSKEGRPPEKGYWVTGIVGLTFPGLTVCPIFLKAYSTSQPGFRSSHDETISKLGAIYSSPGEASSIVSMDRGYDSADYMNFIMLKGQHFVIRARIQRRYRVSGHPGETLNIRGIEGLSKGRYAIRYESGGKSCGGKAAAFRVTHDDIARPLTMIVVYPDNGSEARHYLTDMPCRRKEDIERALFIYRIRWRVEESFRFMKQELGMERMRVRSLKAMNNMLICMEAAEMYLSWVAARKGSDYRMMMSSIKSFPPSKAKRKEYSAKAYEMYTIKWAVARIVSHITRKPEPKRRARRKKDEQLRLF
jgi:hypothetical protein